MPSCACISNYHGQMTHDNFFELGKNAWKRHMNLGPAKVGTMNGNSTNENTSDKAKTARKRKYITRNEYREHNKNCRAVGRNIVESHFYEITVIVLTFIALFMEDVEILLLTSPFWDTANSGRS